MVEILRQFLGLPADTPYMEYIVNGSICISVVLLCFGAIALYKLWLFIIRF